MVILKSMDEKDENENIVLKNAETAPIENNESKANAVPEVQPVAPVAIEWKKPLLITFIICVAGVLLMYFLKK